MSASVIDMLLLFISFTSDASEGIIFQCDGKCTAQVIRTDYEKNDCIIAMEDYNIKNLKRK